MKIFLLLLVGLLISGCGGSGNDELSTFSGRFAGEWAVMSPVGGEPTDGGIIDMVISEKGQISGTFTDTSPAQSGSLSGRIRNDGEISFRVNFESGSIQYAGDARLEGNRLVGFFGEPGVGYINFPGFDLERQL